MSPAVVAEYRTQLPEKALLQAKLHEFYQLALSPADEKDSPEPSKPTRRKRT